MGSRDVQALEREARKYVRLVDIRTLTELEERMCDTELSSRP
jgi:hypothetical protein